MGRLLLRVELENDFALAVAILLALEPVIHRRKRNVRFDELRGFFDELLELFPRLADVPPMRSSVAS